PSDGGDDGGVMGIRGRLGPDRGAAATDGDELDGAELDDVAGADGGGGVVRRGPGGDEAAPGEVAAAVGGPGGALRSGLAEGGQSQAGAFAVADRLAERVAGELEHAL